MFFKSLQLRLIIIFSLLISIIIIGMGSMSIVKAEEIYYKGFVDEMVNTIAGFGLNIKNIKFETNQENLFNENLIQGPKQKEDYEELLRKIYDNFTIYFSINSKSRSGMIVDKNFNDVITSEKYNLSSTLLECVNTLENGGKLYASCNDEEND